MTELESILNKGHLFKIKNSVYVYPNGSGLPDEEVNELVEVYTSEKDVNEHEMLFKRNIYTKEEVLSLVENGMKLEISDHLKEKDINNPNPLMKLVEDGAFSMKEASFMYDCFNKQNRDTFTFERDSCRITIKLFKE